MKKFPWVHIVGLGVVWTVLVWVGLNYRPLMPIDETRYLSVAWEMWLRSEWLVPHLNAEPYTHKPPLLFWLIKAGWVVFGVGDTWPRLVAPLFGLGALGLAWALARRLWPNDTHGVAILVPWILLGSLLWTVFATLTMFDMLNAFFSVLGALGVVMAWQGRARIGWPLVGLAIGLGVLAKGPVILVYILPVALLAPWWADPKPNWIRWYGGFVGALAAGAVIALAWAIPAGIAGGEEYRNAIFWGQTVGRVNESFAHGRPFYWYLLVIPVVLFPWVIWPPIWRGVRGMIRNTDPAIRFALAWAVPGVVILSFISGKQPHYLLPLFPPFALLMAAAVGRESLANGREPKLRDQMPAGLAMIAGGVGLVGLIWWINADSTALGSLGWPRWVSQVSIGFGGVVAITGLILALKHFKSFGAATIALTLSSAIAVSSVHVFVFGAGGYAYDLERMAQFLRLMETEQRQLLMINEYHGQFNYLGRLKYRVDTIPELVAQGWFLGHTRGRVIIVSNLPPPNWLRPWFVQAYRGRYMSVWDMDTYPVFRNWLLDEGETL
jgi:4-amino-4-deoxy-L-arabinose transferase-like glycosyltransferase